jgi:hypothetical protein
MRRSLIPKIGIRSDITFHQLPDRINLSPAMDEELPSGEILFYESEDGSLRLDVRLQDETIWLSQAQMATLFQKGRSTISEHIQNLFTEGELEEKLVCRNFRHTTPHGAIEGKTQTATVRYYNLDVAISVGYRVKSLRGTQFRIWATQRLKEYLIKGFTIDDTRLKEAGSSRYFEELLQKIRDIRSSEKVFWRKVLDIFATSIDYSPQAELAKEFFAQVQNQLHWAAHGHTAAEIIYQRADANQPNMGVTNYPGQALLKRDTEVAKNYLTDEELNLLNRIVTAYLELAEVQALSHNTMTMLDWNERLQQFLTLTGRDVLDHAGQISRNRALAKAHEEYLNFKAVTLEEPSEAEKHFLQQTEKELKALETKRRATES